MEAKKYWTLEYIDWDEYKTECEKYLNNSDITEENFYKFSVCNIKTISFLVIQCNIFELCTPQQLEELEDKCKKIYKKCLLKKAKKLYDDCKIIVDVSDCFNFEDIDWDKYKKECEKYLGEYSCEPCYEEVTFDNSQCTDFLDSQEDDYLDSIENMASDEEWKKIKEECESIYDELFVEYRELRR